MRNRAKCRLCETVIESHQEHDLVSCVCGEIAIDGGDKTYMAHAKNFQNFLRIDDEGKVLEVQYVEKPEEGKLTKAELLDMLEENIKALDRLPPHAMAAPMTNYDYYAFGSLVLSILRSD